MSQYDNTNRGVLFDNDRKETDKHPDMTGSLNINGVDHWFSGWWKESGSGTQFLSLSIGKPKDGQGQQQRQEPQRQQQRPGNRPPQGNRPAPSQSRAPARQSSGFDDEYQ